MVMIKQKKFKQFYVTEQTTVCSVSYNVTINCTVTVSCSSVCVKVNILITPIFNAS